MIAHAEDELLTEQLWLIGARRSYRFVYVAHNVYVDIMQGTDTCLFKRIPTEFKTGTDGHTESGAWWMGG